MSLPKVEESIREIQQAEIPLDIPFSSEALARTRLDFAQRCFTNAQELTRLMDQKANYILAAVGLLTAALGSLASRALEITPDANWLWLKPAGAVFTVAYMLIAFATIYNATRVYIATPHSLRPRTSAPGLLFPLMLLERFRTDTGPDEELYFDKLSVLTPKDILRDYSNQIVEISNIYQSKQRRINLSIGLFRGLIGCWIITLLLLLAIIVLSH